MTVQTLLFILAAVLILIDHAWLRPRIEARLKAHHYETWVALPRSPLSKAPGVSDLIWRSRNRPGGDAELTRLLNLLRLTAVLLLACIAGWFATIFAGWFE